MNLREALQFFLDGLQYENDSMREQAEKLLGPILAPYGFNLKLDYLYHVGILNDGVSVRFCYWHKAIDGNEVTIPLSVFESDDPYSAVEISHAEYTVECWTQNVADATQQIKQYQNILERAQHELTKARIRLTELQAKNQCTG